MMIATRDAAHRQMLGAVRHRCLRAVWHRRSADGLSDRQDLLFLGREQLVDLGDRRIGRLLHVAGEARVSSSLISWSFSSFLSRSIPSRRTWRTATRAASAYLCATFTSSLRRSWLSSGMRRRMHLAFGRGVQAEVGIDDRPSRPPSPSTCPRPGPQIRRGSGTLTVATLVERHAMP